MLLTTLNDFTERESRALKIGETAPDPNLLEADATLWGLAAQMCADTPDQAMEYFSLCRTGVEALVGAGEDKIALLASGVLSSFKPAKGREKIVPCLTATKGGSGPSRIEVQIKNPYYDFHDAYWYAMQRLAYQDEATCQSAFGVQLELVQAVKSATHNELRTLARELDLRFEPRFNSDLIPLIFADDPSEAFYNHIKKYQQSLQAS